MKVGKTRTKLAKKIEDMLGQGYSCDPADLRVNKGANVFNDWVSWYGYVKRPNGMMLHISSWSAMATLLKEEKLIFLGNINDPGGITI